MNCWWFFVLALFAVATQGHVLKIIGGNDAKIENTPYQLQLEDEGYLFCGASIIDKFFALTSASCVDGFDKRRLTLRAGSDRRSYGGQSHQAFKINVHPKYDEYYHDYDVAVLEVATPFRLDDLTKIIPLAAAEPAAGVNVRVSGWGRTDEEGSTVNQLQSVDFPIFPRTNCTDIYSGDVTDRMICAGLKGKDACEGDSGSPLVSIQTQIQVGIRSWSYGCARDGYPGIYTNIANQEIKNFISCVVTQQPNCTAA